jgi:hypothetical protein
MIEVEAFEQRKYSNLGHHWLYIDFLFCFQVNQLEI